MPTINNNTLFIGATPKQGCSATNSQSGGCSSVGNNPIACKGKRIGPRRSRGIVIQQGIEYALRMMGAPTIDIEIDYNTMEMIVTDVMDLVEYYAGSEWYSYYQFRTIPLKSFYEMPDDIAYVRSVNYRQTAEYAFTASDLGGSIPLEYFYPGGAYASMYNGVVSDPIQPLWGHAGEWFAYKSYERMYSRLSSGLGGWEFIDGYNKIKIYPIPYRPYTVSVHYMPKCYDWKELALSIREGILARTKQVLGRIRSKYSQLPGPGGGITLDGQNLLTEGNDEWTKFNENLITKWGDVPTLGIFME